MRLLLAIILPWFQFFTIGRPFAGIICLILQITLIASWFNYINRVADALGVGRE